VLNKQFIPAAIISRRAFFQAGSKSAMSLKKRFSLAYDLPLNRTKCTSKSPLNMFRRRKLTLRTPRNSCVAGGGDGVPFGIFLAIIKGWELSLTCRQGDFAEDLSEEGKRTKA
jgi:hypothetical protein